MPAFLAVALCTLNHADRLARTLAGLAHVQSPSQPWEFLVIDNASSDATLQLLAAPGWRPAGVEVRVVCEEKLGLYNARNRALLEARGDYLLFMADDETPDPAWLTECATPIFGGNFSFRRSVFERIGNFDTRLGRQGIANIGGEDTEIYRRLLEHGRRVRWVPEVIIHHRIQTPKLRRSYFLDLHFRQGRMEGARKRSSRSRLPPRYLVPQILRAYSRALAQRIKQDPAPSLRQGMNAAYFAGYFLGWVRAAT